MEEIQFKIYTFNLANWSSSLPVPKLSDPLFMKPIGHNSIKFQKNIQKNNHNK